MGQWEWDMEEGELWRAEVGDTWYMRKRRVERGCEKNLKKGRVVLVGKGKKIIDCLYIDYFFYCFMIR